MAICARCDKPIKGKPKKWDHISPSAAGTPVADRGRSMAAAGREGCAPRGRGNTAEHCPSG